ncbi:DUF4265 domain-containing protein [Streptomyces microflavus]|uniref:DUF4265 domain-containing protein n=1 Tax=Streptomyces microflavus TaxID=1919 RepID=UPI0029A64CF2|nr:DUF4265 domain-containing protein [Streptomyces microflavus]MDX2403839.1 DUF4265 domain-containing protein [Streptomyces microflavus]
MSSPAGPQRPPRDERPAREQRSAHDERPPRDVGRQIKVWFRFVPREDWLPYDTEGLWATRLSADTARVDNVPFLQDGVAEGETVRFRTDADGVHWSTGRVADSGNCTVRVLSVPDGPLGRDAHAVHERFAPFGLGGEVFSADFPLVALTVPGGADLRGIKALLARGRDEGWWHFEVSCATDAWRAA